MITIAPLYTKSVNCLNDVIYAPNAHTTAQKIRVRLVSLVAFSIIASLETFLALSKAFYFIAMGAFVLIGMGLRRIQTAVSDFFTPSPAPVTLYPLGPVPPPPPAPPGFGNP